MAKARERSRISSATVYVLLLFVCFAVASRQGAIAGDGASGPPQGACPRSRPRCYPISGRRERPSRAAPGPRSTAGRLHVRVIPADLKQQVDNEHPPLSEHGETNTLKRVRFPRPIVLGGRRVMTRWQAPQASPASSREPRSRNPTPCPTIRSAALFMVAARSAPSRDASISQQAAALAKAFPLDRALRSAAVRASRSEHPRKVELISLHHSFVCLPVSSARIVVPITTGEFLRARRDRTATVRWNIRGDCVAGVSTLAAVAFDTFLTLTGASRSIGTLGVSSVCVCAHIAGS
jgi:hypothetical protein